MSASSEKFDYVIIGGGTTGLAVASRLSEDPTITVLVIEAGEPNIGDPNILVPAQFRQNLTNPKYDWAFLTEKQKFSNDRQYLWSRGKGLGGSSALNFYSWIKPPATDIDAIEKLGNPGWNWSEYLQYSQRSETFHPPAKEQTDLYPHTYEPKFHGTSGPIHTTIPFHFHIVDQLFQQTMVNKGLRAIEDPCGGDITGTWIASANLNPSDWTRSYSTTGYYLPARDRPNLMVLTEAMVTRILFDDAKIGEPLTAIGVEYVHNASTIQAKVNSEVILSAGTIQSPKILELSGIGRPEILAQLGVEARIHLDGVGENVQEHLSIGVSYELAGSPPTYDRMRDAEYAAEARRLHANGRGPQRMGITSFAYFPLSTATMDAPALIDRAASNTKACGPLPPGLQDQFNLQLECLHDDSAPDLEVIAFPAFFSKCVLSTPELGKSYITLIAVLNHPFSRGTIHAKSRDPFDNPSIDPHYFEYDFDLESLVQHIKFIRTMAKTEPLKSGILREVDPGPNCVTDQDIREYIKNHVSTTWHTVGSCSMLPRHMQGVVDPELKVYGTSNLRVVDVSIIPIHIAAHIQATAYMIAEKAADLIRASRLK
ncbi:GMC oxidoreductase [Mycena galericulata]|nr:GMC oxidoreductase [Mycena galericulata]